ncbi:hypothetical protein EC912_101746 [Luteibacter rhizovicinus]|uniref:Uncharacterized protein n=1 Tax=Luteibacter rhizovicinus TaxID=242606 RepID=A0A4V2W519_9GAMM|nr:hypothetical protein EC912_101746 [Luteibacter rhizovicinus]
MTSKPTNSPPRVPSRGVSQRQANTNPPPQYSRPATPPPPPKKTK